MLLHRQTILVVGLVWLLPVTITTAQQNDYPDAFDVKSVMIPMRDGVRLHARVFTPKNQKGDLPIILNRTPYEANRGARHFTTYFKSLAEEGYIFVFQDIRGKFRSKGTFVMQRPPRNAGDTSTLDEGTDTYDTIEWLIKNIPHNNQRVGMLGVSYDGWTTIMAAIEPHPALKAISPQGSPADMWLGDDFHHNGAFRLSYGFEYAAMMESTKNVKQFAFNRHDTYDWYLNLGPLSNVNAKYLNGKIPTWNDFENHPDYDEFWKKQTMIPHLRDVKVPTLNVAGWWDQEDFYGPLRIYQALEKHDKDRKNFLVVGPWNHSGWSRENGERLGLISFDSATSKYFRDEIQAPWFAFFLKDKGKLDFPEALTFESGSNRWKKWEAWPPVQVTQERKLYLGPNKTLTFEMPTATPPSFDQYVSDPAHPVPYRQRPIQATYFPGGSKWSSWLIEDQRFVDSRPDVLSWETPVLDADVVLAGDVHVRLFASTTGSDADWIVKLIDVHPEHNPENWDLAGYQLMVSNEVFRGRYRKSYEKPEPIPADVVQEYSFSLHTQNYNFKKGHRIMVQVQSTWFPLIDRNPQTFVPNIFKARVEDFQKATHRIHRSGEHASHVTLAVMGKGP